MSDQSSRHLPPATRRTLLTWSTVALVLILVVVLIVVKFTGTTTTLTAVTVPVAVAAPASIVKQATHVPAAIFTEIGETSSPAMLQPLHALSHQSPIAGKGQKPEVVFIGDEFQSASAPLRWALVVALSRFGTFSGLQSLQSGTQQVFPGTASLGFAGAKYKSPYLRAVFIERTSNQKNAADTAFAPLTHVPGWAQTLLTHYDRPTAFTGVLELPFLDLNNQFVQVGGPFSPAYIEGLTSGAIARSLSDATAPSTHAVIAAANALVADLCVLTTDAPSGVCTPQAATTSS